MPSQAFLASRSRWALHGVISLYSEATPIIGRLKSSPAWQLAPTQLVQHGALADNHKAMIDPKTAETPLNARQQVQAVERQAANEDPERNRAAEECLIHYFDEHLSHGV